jgi:hypothetical protein
MEVEGFLSSMCLLFCSWSVQAAKDGQIEVSADETAEASGDLRDAHGNPDDPSQIAFEVFYGALDSFLFPMAQDGNDADT